jgi:hypothetical protein
LQKLDGSVVMLAEINKKQDTRIAAVMTIILLKIILLAIN